MILLHHNCNFILPDDFSVLVPFYSLLVGGEHGIRLFSLFEEAAFPVTLTLHHQVVVFGFDYGRLLQVILHVTLITGANIYPEETLDEIIIF